MEKQPEDSPKPVSKATGSSKKQYDSNPFTTALTGIKRLFELNTGTLIATVVFNIGIMVVTVLALFAMIVATAAFVVNHVSEVSSFVTYYLPSDVYNFTSGLSDLSIYITWVLGFVVILCLGALLQAVQIKLVTASAAAQHISLGDIFKHSFKRILPLLGFSGLMLLVVIAVCILMGLFANALGPIAVAIGMIGMIAAFYFGVRIAYTTFAIVEENLGPIQSVKRSWELTDGHFAETVGVIATSLVIIVLPTGIISALSINAVGGFATFLQVISGLLGLIIGTIMTAAIAERFQQLRDIKSGKYGAPGKANIQNYLAVVYLIAAYVFLAIVTPQPKMTTPVDIYNSDNYYNSGTDYTDDYYNNYSNDYYNNDYNSDYNSSSDYYYTSPYETN